MQVRLPDGNLITIEPVVDECDPDYGRPITYLKAGFKTWLKVNDEKWRMMAYGDFAALLIDVAKEAKTIDEYEAYLKEYWAEQPQCDVGMIVDRSDLHNTLP